MSARLHRLSLPGALLARGFWLYVWEVVTANGRTVLYVGMTGDTSSPNAQSPFGRLSQHLGGNENSNALYSHLERNGIDPVNCKLDLIAYGPILSEADNMTDHSPRWSKVAALEKKLCDELRLAGYDVVNDVHYRQQLDDQLWRTVRAAFSPHFPKLKSLSASAMARGSR